MGRSRHRLALCMICTATEAYPLNQGGSPAGTNDALTMTMHSHRIVRRPIHRRGPSVIKRVRCPDAYQ